MKNATNIILIPNRGQFKKHCLGKVPDKGKSIRLLRQLIDFLFPILSHEQINLKDDYILSLERDLHQLLQEYDSGLDQKPGLADAFCHKLPAIYQQLTADAEAIYAGDPAAASVDEVVITYPGFYAILIHRLAHGLHELSVPIIPRLWSEYAHGKTAIDIHPAARIGQSFCIDHGTGIVIGESCVIGNHVKLYQGVTLGAASVAKEKAGTKRHPTIEDFVTIYAGSTILGGQTVIGHHSVVGGNVWLTESIAPYSMVVNKHEIRLLGNQPAKP